MSMPSTSQGSEPPIDVGSTMEHTHITRSVDLKRLHWLQFEYLIASMYRAMGYTVRHAMRFGWDGGFDLKIGRDSRTALVQCKHYATTRVGVTAIRELFAVNTMENPGGQGVVVTTSRFTREALAWAARSGIECVDREQLQLWWRTYGLDGDTLIRNALAVKVPLKATKRGSALLDEGRWTPDSDIQGALVEGQAGARGFKDLLRAAPELRGTAFGAGGAQPQVYPNEQKSLIKKLINCLLDPDSPASARIKTTLLTTEIPSANQRGSLYGLAHSDYYWTEPGTTIRRLHTWGAGAMLRKFGVSEPRHSLMMPEDLALLQDFLLTAKASHNAGEPVPTSIRLYSSNPTEEHGFLRSVDRILHCNFSVKSPERETLFRLADGVKIWDVASSQCIQLDMSQRLIRAFE